MANIPAGARIGVDFSYLPTLYDIRWVQEATEKRKRELDDRPDYAFAEGVTYRVGALEDGAEASASVPDLHGKTAARVTVRRKGRAIEASVEGVSKGWRLQLSGTKSVESVEGGAAEADPLGVVIKASGGAATIRARLPAGA